MFARNGDYGDKACGVCCSCRPLVLLAKPVAGLWLLFPTCCNRASWTRIDILVWHPFPSLIREIGWPWEKHFQNEMDIRKGPRPYSCEYCGHSRHLRQTCPDRREEENRSKSKGSYRYMSVRLCIYHCLPDLCYIFLIVVPFFILCLCHLIFYFLLIMANGAKSVR